MTQSFSSGGKYRLSGRRLTILAFAAVAWMGAACHPHSGVQAGPGAALTQPVFHGGYDYVTVIRQQDGQRFDYLVHLVGGEGGRGSVGKKLARRLKRAKRAVHHRCKVAQMVDLYQHRVGVRANGRAQISYSMGVVCKKHTHGR